MPWPWQWWSPNYSPPHGPSLEAIDADGPDKYYGTTWRRLERVLGMPAPSWHSSLRDPELMMAWRPGATTLEVPAVVVPAPGPLLRLAAQEPDGSRAGVAALDTARRAVWSETKSCHDEIGVKKLPTGCPRSWSADRRCRGGPGHDSATGPLGRLLCLMPGGGR
ncbi:hypothetical protein WDV06_23475 [Streptomyces racemochromogenes]|uniref:Uncharacterized protein n=1 Tax=Streptomyces racemochromogenes TaxID=67353 RepID=A0ABW7PIG2_9ACTN